MENLVRGNRVIHGHICCAAAVHAVQTVVYSILVFKSFLSIQSCRNASPAECDQPGTAAHLAGWWLEAGVWRGGGVILQSSCSKRLTVFPW